MTKTLFLILFALLWANRARAEIDTQLFGYEGKAYLRVCVPPGPEDATGRRIKAAAFKFALDELESRGSITPDIRKQIEAKEAPTEKTGYVLVVPVTVHADRIDFDPILGVIRADVGSLRFVERVNSIRADASPLDAGELVKRFLGERGQAAADPMVVEPKNFVLRQVRGRPPAFGGFLVSSLLEKLVPANIDAAFLETDLGPLSEFYVRGLGGWNYRHVFREANGDEVTLSDKWKELDGKQRGKEIRKVLGPDKEKHLAVLAADKWDIQSMRLKADTDPTTSAMRLGFIKRSVPLSDLSGWLDRLDAACPPHYKQLAAGGPRL